MLQDLHTSSCLMGSVTVVLSDDFRQTLPLIPRRTNTNELKGCLKFCFVETFQIFKTFYKYEDTFTWGSSFVTICQYCFATWRSETKYKSWRWIEFIRNLHLGQLSWRSYWKSFSKFNLKLNKCCLVVWNGNHGTKEYRSE